MRQPWRGSRRVQELRPRREWTLADRAVVVRAVADRGEPYGWPPPGVMAPLPVTLVVTCFGLPP
jgi:hypothetical protein